MVDHYYYRSKSNVVLGHITSQIAPQYEIKSGFEVITNDYNEEGFSLIFDDQNYIGRRYFDEQALSTIRNRFQPLEAASFLQTKMEFISLVLNLGLRYDYFDSRANIPTDFKDPGNTYNVRPQKEAYNQAGAKTQLSPRFGLSYRITESGFIRAAYGHFFQIPPYAHLYQGVDYRIMPGNLTTHIGNPNLDPERTVIYELGLQQQITSSMALDMSVFSKDIRSLLGTKIEQTYIRSDVYSRFINRDYGNVRGVTLALNNFGMNVNLSVDYTFQVAKGNSSDPLSVLFDAKSNRESEKKLVHLDWDQTHTINLSLGFSTTKDLNVGIIGSFGTGLPYTPSRPDRKVELADKNSARRPFHHNFDFRSEKTLPVGNLKLRFFVKIENLFDTRNENIVWTDTGRAGYTLLTKYLGDLSEPVNTIDEYFTHPEWYSPPRSVKIGFGLKL
jgi:outer membrane receptor protein involved in Fe transport